MSPNQLNAYEKGPVSGAFVMGDTGLEHVGSRGVRGSTRV
jgi:hypothetical protein